MIGESTRRALRDDFVPSLQRVLLFKRVRSFSQYLLLSHALSSCWSTISENFNLLIQQKNHEISEKDVAYLKNKLSVVGDSDELTEEYRQFCIGLEVRFIETDHVFL